MTDVSKTAKLAGVIYFIFMIIAIVGEFLLPSFIVPEDAPATAQNITSSEFIYRIGIALGLITHVIFIILVLILFKLFREVDKYLAILMVLLVSIGVATALANLLNKFVPLVLLHGKELISVFSKEQVDALTLVFLKFHNRAAVVSTAFWGLWLFPFGILVIKSGFIPRVLGILLLIAGSAYLFSSITSIIIPDYRQIISKIIMPLYFGEVPIIFWLLIKGTKTNT